MIQLTRLVKSFGYAFEGLQHAFTYDQNLRIHFLVAIVVIIFCVVLGVSALEMGLLGVMIILVITTEMINTAIERMVDLITKEHRVEAKIAKDVSSGMVFVSAVGSVIVGVLIFLPYILRLFW